LPEKEICPHRAAEICEKKGRTLPAVFDVDRFRRDAVEVDLAAADLIGEKLVDDAPLVDLAAL